MKKQFNKIYIEITNVCNLNCSFCPKTKRSPEFMSFELFKKSVDQAKPLTREIALHLMGEPLLHPKLKEFVNYAQEQGVRINLTTNGTLIEDKFDILTNPAMDRINFSIHSIKDNFSSKADGMQVTDTPKLNILNSQKQKPIFNKTKEELLKIIEFTKKAQKVRDDLIIIYRLWNINDTSNKEIYQTIEEEFNMQITETNEKGSTQIFKKTYIQYDESFEWPDNNKEDNPTPGYCHGVSKQLGILAEGTVVPCCLDGEGNIPLGDINNNTITEIINSPRALAMKKGFQERRLVEEMCKKCTFINRLERNKK